MRRPRRDASTKPRLHWRRRCSTSTSSCSSTCNSRGSLDQPTAAARLVRRRASGSRAASSAARFRPRPNKFGGRQGSLPPIGLSEIVQSGNRGCAGPDRRGSANRKPGRQRGQQPGLLISSYRAHLIRASRQRADARQTTRAPALSPSRAWQCLPSVPRPARWHCERQHRSTHRLSSSTASGKPGAQGIRWPGSRPPRCGWMPVVTGRRQAQPLFAL